MNASESKAGPRLRQVPAVTRAIAILRLLGRGGEPRTLKAISEELDMVTSTCLHILRVLAEEGLVKVDTATKRYSLGVGMLALARSVIESNPFPALVQPVLDRLANEAGVTAIGVEVAALEHMVVVALSRSRAPFRLHVDVGSRFPALISATGRLVAAYSDVGDAEIERRFKALRWDQPPDIEAWRREVENVRRKGYSIDRGNYINGVALVAVPVLDRHGRLTHTLVAAALANQLSAARAPALAKELQAEAAALSELLAARS
ncbi:IclR family transcriptional regulator [Bordetella pseudohinzii]|uniref:Negative regulator of allantoin and glyoxylate utilization operons n=1 Tax=Bordetella pseudohinzii TaxID=1331258 RepID=A0A0J6C2U8_9BORD|nr:IclR family transcriptional regulator [Bordetella pseudohinzii]ANY16127.1 transcriptional regulator [Bordetella pseudohinzii]KMM25388.1 transcriptional regulator [Bordetella pseudohinzii]KXA76567.1 transcriptional regulator [Bordetella pseudohinzii]KXA81276.1 transcriptional regulator [Bordetella pseudohinzii]CUJ03617.1 Negative regulator of allantoin and glyoxylate utilization operons [Bordetella pseudohinzii]